MSDLRRIYGKLTYDVHLVELAASDAVELDGYRVGAYATAHGAESLGYAVVEDDRPGRFDAERARVGVREGPSFGLLQHGTPVEANGRMVEPSEVLGDARPGRKIVLSGDTMPCEATALISQGAELLYTRRPSSTTRRSGRSKPGTRPPAPRPNWRARRTWRCWR